MPTTATDPATRARDLAARLAPVAERTDVEGVSRASLDELGAAGLLGLSGPRGYGGADAPAGVVREVTEALGGACGATWFVWAQHASPVQALARSANVALKERRLRELCTGGLLAGVAFSHLRRAGAPAVLATRADGGWVFDGTAPWATSWGLADVLALSGLTEGGQVVQVLLPARDQPGLTGPRGYGGADAPPGVVREVTEALGGACGATWFVWAQHASPVQALSRSGNVALKERRLRELCTGGLLAGVAFSHLRRAGTPAVLATRADGGWVFDGTAPWATSWGLADVLALSGLTADGQVVQVLLPARDQPGLTASADLRLAAMQATSTVSLELRGLRVADADVVEVVRVEQWREADRLRTANVGPATFGLLATVVSRLRETGSGRGGPTAVELARRLAEEAEDLRRAAYALLDHVPADEQVEDRLALRAAVLELAVRAATSLVAASGGSALALTAPPQRLLREALFHLVMAQTGPVREATLHRLLEQTA